jgi:hypothetical protein
LVDCLAAHSAVQKAARWVAWWALPLAVQKAVRKVELKAGYLAVRKAAPTVVQMVDR